MKPFLLFRFELDNKDIDFYQKLEIRKVRRRHSFEMIERERLSKDIIKVSYEWADSVRVEDKYKKTLLKRVDSLVFESQKRVLVFGHFESDINYFVSKFTKKTGVSLHFVKFYDEWLEGYNKGVAKEKLVAFSYKKSIFSYDDENVKKISGSKLGIINLVEILNNEEYEVLSLVLKNKIGLSFEVDRNSSISFKETYNNEEKMSVIKYLVGAL